MIDALTSLLTSPAMDAFVNHNAWVWPIAEILHFFGLALLMGTVGLLDLRLLGFVRAIPVAALERLVPWGISGFILCLLSGLVFVTGVAVGPGAYLTNFPFQAKMACVLLAGINVGAFYLTGLSRRADATGANEDAPLGAQIIAACSFVLWMGVIYFGRMIMYGSTWEDIFHW